MGVQLQFVLPIPTAAAATWPFSAATFATTTDIATNIAPIATATSSPTTTDVGACF